MKKFLWRICFLTIVLLFGILVGINQSQKGSLSYTDLVPNPKVIQEVQLSDAPSQTLQEEKKTERELVEKQEIAEELRASNFYSELGTKLGDLFHHLFSSFLSTIIGTIHSLLHSK